MTADGPLYADEVYAIQGAIFEVSNTLGSGFLEAVYQECLALEFAERGVPFAAKPQLTLSCKGKRLSQTYIPDFVCFGTIVIEIKAASQLTPEHRAQVLNYLRATGLKLGLLVNFGRSRAEIERFAM